MHSIENVFVPLIGQITWSARRTHGSMMLMEFGSPRLDVGTVYTATGSPGSVPTLRRPAHARGEWTFHILDCEWTLEVAGEVLSSNDTDWFRYARLLKALDGQKLGTAGQPEGAASLELTFDLGARMKISPATDPAVAAGDDQWTLFLPDGRNASLTNGGRLVEMPAG